MLFRALRQPATFAVLLATQTGCLGMFGTLKPPPKPDSHATARALPEIPPSTLSARFAIPIGWIRDSIDAYLPREIVGPDSWSQPFDGNDSIQTKHAIYRRGLTLAFDGAPGDRALLQNAIEFRLTARQRLANTWRPEVSCAWENRAAAVATLVRGQLAIMTSFIPQPDWSLETRSSLVGVSTDACPIHLPDVKISDVLNRLVSTHLTPGLAAIDTAIRARLNFAELVAPLWTRAQTPLTIDKDVKLVLNPKAARLAPMVVKNDSLIGAIGIVGTPSIWIGGKPPVKAALPLPKLDIGPVDSVSVIRTAIVLSDSAIRRAIADTLVGMRVRRKFGPLSFSTTVKDVGFFAVGDTAVVRVTLAGRVRGDVYAMGVPTYDPKTRVFMLTDVSLTAASTSFLTRAAFAAGRGALERAIERSARIELGPRLDSLERRLDNVADQDLGPLRLQVAIKEIAPVGIFRLEEGFATLVNMRGSARITGREP